MRAVIRHRWAVRAFRLLHPDWGAALARATSHTSRNVRPRDGGEGLRARLFAGRPASLDPALLAETSFPDGKRGAEVFGKWVADTLAADGWPREETPERAWYKTPWFWGILLAVGVAAALGAGGGGGGTGGSSGGTVAVEF